MIRPPRVFRSLLVLRALALAGLAAFALAAWAQDTRRWQPLVNDGVHDPKSPAIGLLQEPREALSRLAPDTAGNKVRWMESLTRGEISPRSRVEAATNVELRESEIYLNLKGGTPIVKFPHNQHTLWLACSNCHDGLFKREVGATKLDMGKMLMGEQCGLCHGAVAFPLTECDRCHNTPRAGFEKPALRADGARTGAVLAVPPGLPR